MRILFVSSSSGSRGGGELFLYYLGEALVQRGHQVALWTASHERMDELSTKFSRLGEVQRVSYRNTYDHRTRLLGTCFNFLTSARAANQWNQWKPDVVHINKQNLEDGLDLIRAGSRTSLPNICTIHITQSARFLKAKAAPLRDFMSKRALARYNAPIVAVHEIRRQELNRFLGNGRSNLYTVMNGVRITPKTVLQPLREKKRIEFGFGKEQKLVLGLGRMVQQKRPSMFLSLAEQIHAEVPSTQFLWVGDGAWMNHWDQIVAERKLSTFVRRIPWQTDPVPFLSAADVFLHTAEFEGLPFALLEAMATGLPCAIPAQLAKELAIQDSKGVILLEVISELITALRDDGKLATVAEKGLQLVQQRFSVEKMAEQYEALYLKTISSNLAH